MAASVCGYRIIVNGFRITVKGSSRGSGVLWGK